MKTTLFLLTLVTSIFVSSLFKKELEFANNLSGTAVIAAKTAIKGGDNYAIALPANLTKKQAELLVYAYTVAKADGNQHPEYYQGLLYQESQVGGLKNYAVAGQESGLKPMERYYGVPQMKLVAVKSVLREWPALGKDLNTEEELVAKLITDDKWSIQMGSKYFIQMSRGRTPAEALVAYNKGPGGAIGVDPSTNQYANSVASHIRTVVKSANNSNLKRVALLKTE